MLFVDNGTIEIGIHLSYVGEDNIFFEQPNDMTDLSTPEGFRVRGGHRLWIAPESDNVYYPDNQPISYEISGDSVWLTQDNDPWLEMIKKIKITFVDKETLQIDHEVTNTGEKFRRFSLWAITSLDAGGTEFIPLNLRDGGLDPLHRIPMWDYTNLGDKRAEYKRESITLRHEPLEEKYKIGVGHPAGPVTYTNKGVVFEKTFPICSDLAYPDGDVSFETFMCKHMVEVETLSPYGELFPGDTMNYREIWKLNKV